MAQLDLFKRPRQSWNISRIVGAKPPLKPKHVWAIHGRTLVGRVCWIAPLRCRLTGEIAPAMFALESCGEDRFGALRAGAGRLPRVLPLLAFQRGSQYALDVDQARFETAKEAEPEPAGDEACAGDKAECAKCCRASRPYGAREGAKDPERQQHCANDEEANPATNAGRGRAV